MPSRDTNLLLHQQRRLAQILASLAPDDRALIADLTEPAYARRKRRLTARDEALRALAERFFPGQSAPQQARAAATALGRYLAGGWLQERGLAELPIGASAFRVALHKIARLNDGGSLGERQIRNLLAGTRGR